MSNPKNAPPTPDLNNRPPRPAPTVNQPTWGVETVHIAPWPAQPVWTIKSPKRSK